MLPLAAVAGLMSMGSVRADSETLYVPEGWLYDANYTGAPQGTPGLHGGTSIDPDDPTTILGIADRSASPQGGEWIAGNYVGTLPYTVYMARGIPMGSLIHADGTAATLVDGQTYTANFWMQGNHVVDSSGLDSGFMFEDTVNLRILDGTTARTVLATYDATVAFNDFGWTEVALPFTYNAATMPSTATIWPIFTRASTDWNYDTGSTMDATLANNRIGSMGFDFVTSAAVPEPAGTVMLGIAGMLGLVRRRR